MTQPVQVSRLQNSNTINEILDQQLQFFDSINRNLAPQVLVQLSSLLLQQRKQLKKSATIISDKIIDLQSQLYRQRLKASQTKQYIKTLQDQSQNLRNLISCKQQENEKRFTEMSQSSCSMIEEIAQELKKQRQTNWELKHLVQQLKLKQSQIRKLTINLSKLTQQNQSLKPLLNWNSLLQAQLMQTQKKLTDSKQLEKQLRDEIQHLRENVIGLQEKIAQLQYISINQISNGKDLISQDFETHGKKKVIQYETRHFQHAKLLKQLEQNFHPQFLAESRKRQDSDQQSKTQLQRQKNFENSLDNVSQNWDKISLKQIQASSKSKPFVQNIFPINEPRLFRSQKQKKLQQSLETKRQQINNQQKIRNFKQRQQNYIEQSLLISSSKQKYINKAQQKNERSTVAKKKVNLKIQILQDQQPFIAPLSTRSQRATKVSNNKNNCVTPQQDFAIEHIRFRAETNSQYQKGIFYDSKFESKLKQKRIISLQQKLLQFKKRNQQLQAQLKQIQKSSQNQTKVFKQQSYAQRQSIQRLINQIKQLKLQNLRISQQCKKNEQKCLQKLNYLTNTILEQQKIIKQKQKQIILQKQYKNQLIKKYEPLQSEQQKYKKNMKQIPQKIQQLIQTTKTINNKNIAKIYKQYELKFKYKIQKIQNYTNTDKISYKNIQIQTYNIVQNKDINTNLSFKNSQKYFKNAYTETQAKLTFNKQIQSNQNNNINKQIQTQIIKLKLSKIPMISVPSKQYTSKYMQTNNQPIQPVIQIKSEQKRSKSKKRNNMNQQPIKLFKPTPFVQQLQQEYEIVPIKEQYQFGDRSSQSQEIKKQDVYIGEQLSDQDLNKTQYYSFIQEQYPKVQLNNTGQKKLKYNLEQRSLYNQKQFGENKFCIQNTQLVELYNILITQTVRLTLICSQSNISTNYNIPNINTYKNCQNIKLDDIISRCRKNVKQFYIISALLRKDKQTFTDKIMFWKQGIVSLKLKSSLVMLKAKKYIDDPINLILGNSEIILNKHYKMIEVNRKRKNSHFQGNIQVSKWTLLHIDGYGSY